MEKIRLMLKKLFNIIKTIFLASIILADIGGCLCAILFVWVYKDDKDGDTAGLFGFIFGTILWFILLVLQYNKFWLAN